MTTRVELTPLAVEDAGEMVDVLSDPGLYGFIGGTPPTLSGLRDRYERLAVGRSDDGTQDWFNWVIRRLLDRQAVGTVQATVSDGGASAEIAWVVGAAWQGNGYATEAATLMVAWLTERGITRITAHIHPDHHASIAVARRLGLEPTEHIHDGERLWLRTNQ